MRIVQEGVNSMLGAWRAWLLFSLLLFVAVPAQAALSPEVQKGLSWLQSQVQADGSLAGEAASIATPLQGRTEALFSLKLLANIPAPLAAAIAANTEDNTEYLARQAISSSLSGQNSDAVMAALVARQNADGGFGGALNHESNPLDTAWAMLAMHAANNIGAALPAATSYMQAVQDVSGGYSVPGNGPHPYVTAVAMTALQASSNSPATVNALNKANAWILSRQSADGSWGGIAETSIVYLALLGSISDSGLQSGVSAYLQTQQGGDGSWGGDPYFTALALRALIAQPQALSTTGNVMLHVIDSATGQPLAGVQAVIEGAVNAPSLSDTDGKIMFQAVAAGNYTMTVSADGYTAQSLNFSVQAGTTVDLGIFKMQIVTTTGILKGVVKDASTGTALTDATIAVTGIANASVLTSSDGSYSLTGLAPGAVTVSASKAGYASVGGTGTIVAGSALLFSPSLPLAGQQIGTTGSIVGQVVDAVSLAPLAGVMVESTGISTITGADGKFSLAGIAAGTYQINFSLAGYATKSYPAVMISAGSTTDFQMVVLGKATNSVALQGKVTDASSGKALNQVTVTVLGTPFSAVTDSTGSYRIEGLATGAATLRFNASGYTSETVAVNFPSFGEYRLDKTLSLDTGTNLTFVSLTTDQASYPAYAPVAVQMEIANNSVQSINDAVVDITVFDPQGQVVNTHEAIRVDANGVAQNHFTFLPKTTTAVDGKWSTQSYAPGAYQIKARVFTEEVASGIRTVLAERTVAFTIAPSQTVLRLSVTPLPAYTTFDATEQMSFKVEASHQSNQPVSVSFKYQFKTPGGTVLKEESATLALQAIEVVGSVILGPFPYHFTASGVYPVALTSTGGVVPQVVASGEVQVAPGIRVEPTQHIAPNIVTPDGDKRIRIQLQLKGVEQK